MSKKVNYKKQSFRFKDVDITFDFNRIPTYDREYLKTMVIETINTKSIKNSGQSFDILDVRFLCKLRCSCITSITW